MLGQFFMFSALSGNNNVLRCISLVLLLVEVAGRWSVLTKANRQGWSQFIPIWGDLVYLEVAELPWWWILGLMVPVVTYVVQIMIGLCIARNFDKGTLFGLGLAFFPFIFYPILGFNGDEWGGPGGNDTGI